MDGAFLIAALVFIGTVLFLAGVLSVYAFQSERIKIINKIKGEGEKSLLSKKADVFSTSDTGIRKQFLSFIGSLGHFIKPKKEEDISITRQRLMQAGFRRQNSFLVLFGFKIFFAVLFAGTVIFSKIFIIKTWQQTNFMVLSICLAVIGFYLPDVWLNMKIARRKDRILAGFPDALDMMVVCVEAGMGPDAAIHRVGEEMRLRNKELSDEFKLLSLELRAGKMRRDALKNLAMRTGLDDVSSLTTLLIQTDRFGTSVAQALRVHSDSMRTRRRQKAEEVAAKLPVKLIFPLILFILPSLFVVVAGPAVIKIVRVFLSRAILPH